MKNKVAKKPKNAIPIPITARRSSKNLSTVLIEVDYPVIGGDVPNVDLLNDVIAGEVDYFEEYYAEYSKYMLEDEVFAVYSEGFVTYNTPLPDPSNIPGRLRLRSASCSLCGNLWQTHHPHPKYCHYPAPLLQPNDAEWI